MDLKDQVVWKEIPGFETLYEVSNDGCVRSLKRSGSRGGLLKQHETRGYMQVWLSKNNKIKRLSVHRAVLMAFVGVPSSEKVCNHKDGNRTNNKLENLEWCTREENEWHKKHVLGEDCKGEKNANYGYRHSKLYPSPKLRNKLCELGIPRYKHNLAELGELLKIAFEQLQGTMINDPRGYLKRAWQRITGFEDEANNRAKLLIHLLEQGLIKK